MMFLKLQIFLLLFILLQTVKSVELNVQILKTELTHKNADNVIKLMGKPMQVFREMPNAIWEYKFEPEENEVSDISSYSIFFKNGIVVNVGVNYSMTHISTPSKIIGSLGKNAGKFATQLSYIKSFKSHLDSKKFGVKEDFVFLSDVMRRIEISMLEKTELKLHINTDYAKILTAILKRHQVASIVDQLDSDYLDILSHGPDVNRIINKIKNLVEK